MTIVRDNQNIMDVTLQEFGTLENLFEVIVPNNLTVTYKLSQAQELLIDADGKGDETIKNFVKTKSIFYNNDQTLGLPPVDGGGYDNGYSNGYN